MYQKKTFLLACLAVLPLLGTGCKTSNFTFQFNDRRIEVEKFTQASLPRGLKVSYFDGKFMMLDGRESIKINGKELTVNASKISFGTFTGNVGSNQKIVITKENSLLIVDTQSGSGSKSWWQFWR